MGEQITDYIDGLAKAEREVSTIRMLDDERQGHPMDVKNVMPGHEGHSYHGFLYHGIYISLREAGNILAGINAASHGIRFETFMRGAGAYNVGAFKFGATVMSGLRVTWGPPPYYGEQDYTGTRVRYGYDLYFRTPMTMSAGK